MRWGSTNSGLYEWRAEQTPWCQLTFFQQMVHASDEKHRIYFVRPVKLQDSENISRRNRYRESILGVFQADIDFQRTHGRIEQSQTFFTTRSDFESLHHDPGDDIRERSLVRWVFALLLNNGSSHKPCSRNPGPQTSEAC